MTAAIIIYITICVLLVLLILLHQSQGGGLGILGGSSDSVLGSSQDTFIGKVIRFLAFLFLTGAIFLSVMSIGEKSILDEEEKIQKAKTSEKNENDSSKTLLNEQTNPLFNGNDLKNEALKTEKQIPLKNKQSSKNNSKTSLKKSKENEKKSK